jgi:hypothetical protein
VVATSCPRCGAPIAPGAGFCTYCGFALAGSSPPLSSSTGAAPPTAPRGGPSTPYYGGPSRPPRQRSSLLTILVLVIVVLLVVGVVAYFFLPSSAPPVQVGYIVIYSPHDVCGLNLTPPGAYYGFNSSTGANQTFDFLVPNYNATACVVRGVSTNTSGFSITYAQVPLPIGGSGNASMNISIVSPSSPFTGNLNLILR